MTSCVCRRHTSTLQIPHPFLIAIFHISLIPMAPQKRGVLVVIKDTISFKSISQIQDKQERYLLLMCEIFNGVYTLINLYLPNVRPLTYLWKIWKTLSKSCQRHTIICRDFNTIPDRDLNVFPLNRSSIQRTTFSHFISSSHLYDVWHCQHSSEKDYIFYLHSHLSYSH